MPAEHPEVIDATKGAGHRSEPLSTVKPETQFDRAKWRHRNRPSAEIAKIVATIAVGK